MTTDRRNFVRNAALGITSGLLSPAAAMAAVKQPKPGPQADDLSRYIVNPGPKKTVRGLKAACSTGSAITTETIVKVLRNGGNAVDAAIAGCMVQAAVEPHLTNHTGTVSFIYYEAATRQFHQLDSTGTFPGGIRPFKSGWKGGGEDRNPSACIPGFMRGMKALHERFASKTWASLCEDAIAWAEEGHPVSSFEHAIYAKEIDALSYYPESRKFFLPEGFLVPVGQRFGSKDLAQTLRRVAAEGPDYMITGGWAKEFVTTANKMGWKIKKEHMFETPPRWIQPLRFKHNEYEIVGLAPPQQQGTFCAIVLGILRHLKIREVEPLSAEHIFYTSHALRWGLYHCGYMGDPVVADYAFEQLLDDNLHASIAKLIAGLRPKMDLAEHVRLTRSPTGPTGWPSGRDDEPGPEPSTCEVSIVDQKGNWVQMTHTLQSGGIPGMAIGGVPMHGSDTGFTGISGPMDSKLIAGTRMRRALGSTIVLRDGAPAFSFGTPGNVYFTIPQVLTYLLDFKKDPYAAIDAPRMLPLNEQGSVTVEDRLSIETVKKLKSLGVGVQVVPGYQYQMGSFQMCFRDEKTGELCATTDPRRTGVADGLQ